MTKEEAERLDTKIEKINTYFFGIGNGLELTDEQKEAVMELVALSIKQALSLMIKNPFTDTPTIDEEVGELKQKLGLTDD
jgi:hypothetical protein